MEDHRGKDDKGTTEDGTTPRQSYGSRDRGPDERYPTSAAQSGTVDAKGELGVAPPPPAAAETASPAGAPSTEPFSRAHALAVERTAVRERRKALGAVRDGDPRSSLAGLALSGGGIRSATFALGVLQSLGERGLLWIFDYLSTVSGGGYAGAWWTGWLARPERGKDVEEARARGEAPATRLFPKDERLEPDRFPATLLDDQNKPIHATSRNVPEGTPDGSRSAWLDDPIHHLRLFSNYLTPRKGVFSGDTWRAIAIISRNIGLTWLILLPLLLSVVLIAQIYFAGNNESAYWFACSQVDSVASDTAWRIPASGESVPRIRDVQRVRHVRVDTTTACTRALAADARTLDALIRARALPVADTTRPLASGVTHGVVLRQRLLVLLDPLLAALLLLAAVTLLWMVFGNGSIALTVIGIATVLGGLVVVLTGNSGEGSSASPIGHFKRSDWYSFGVAGAVIIFAAGTIGFPVVVALKNKFSGRPERRLARDRARNLVARWHARLLVASAVGLVLLLVAGFGHELTWFLFDPTSGTLTGAARKAGGWAALILSLGSGLFTALRAGPTSAGTDTQEKPPGAVTKLVVAVAPVLMLAVLAVSAATLGRWMFANFAAWDLGDRAKATALTGIVRASLIGTALLILFALYERWKVAHGVRVLAVGKKGLSVKTQRNIVVFVALGALVGGILVALFRPAALTTLPRFAVYASVAVAGLLAVLRLSTTKLDGSLMSIATRSYARGSDAQTYDTLRALEMKEVAAERELADAEDALTNPESALDGAERERIDREKERIRQERKRIDAQLRPARLAAYAQRTWLLLRVIGVTVAIAAILWYWLSTLPSRPPERVVLGIDEVIFPLALAGILFSVAFLIVDFLVSWQESDRSVGLVALAALACGSLALLQYLDPGRSATAFAMLGGAMAIYLVTAVVGLGWMADPNLLALHNFYKARLVRAYLGASNSAERRNFEITETAPNDDVLLKDMRKYENRAAVHVVNTTLNLVGGRDLSTAQRFAAPFTMSSEVCGSARTGYHRTADYMGGTLSLGTAVAASGAAVSTNMGSKSVSSALALLLALFNVRLGLWVPTPNKGRWYDPQARLWPFYLLREALSQTNDLGSFCYLTDGGHFDNTGIYSLVERGARYILALDCGADAQPCFSDMGEAIRRCRIDFGAEIGFTTAVDRFIKAKDGGLTSVHYARGTIRYAPSHLKMLGWDDDEIRDSAEGVILWMKPSVTKRDSVDVRQYKLENAVFPQQTTADQWYDESQFESYRALGYQGIDVRLADIAAAQDAAYPKTFDFSSVATFFRTF